MRNVPAPGERPLHWIASAKKDLLKMPRSVVREIGLALSVAQHGGKHPAAKPWLGKGSGVLKVVSNFDGNTFRAVYAVRFLKAIYVLHCFQKKSPRGIQTEKPDVELIEKRLRAAGEDYESRYVKAERQTYEN